MLYYAKNKQNLPLTLNESRSRLGFFGSLNLYPYSRDIGILGILSGFSNHYPGAGCFDILGILLSSSKWKIPIPEKSQLEANSDQKAWNLKYST